MRTTHEQLRRVEHMERIAVYTRVAPDGLVHCDVTVITGDLLVVCDFDSYVWIVLCNRSSVLDRREPV